MSAPAATKSAGMSRKEAAAFQRDLVEAGTAKVDKEYQARLKKIDDSVAKAKVERKERLDVARGSCGIDFAATKAKVGARSRCAALKTTVKTEVAQKVAGLKGEKKGEKVERAQTRAIKGMTRKRAAPKSTRSERQQESDDEVASSLSDDLLPFWEKTKRQFTATERMSRLEAFELYASENPDAVWEAREREGEKKFAEMERQDRASRQPKKRTRHLSQVAHEPTDFWAEANW